MLQALALQAAEDTDRAIAVLEKALTLAEPEGFVRIFVDEGPPMARLLYEAATRGIAPDYARQLLAAFPVAEPEQTGPSRDQAPESELVEPLSERELEVLATHCRRADQPRDRFPAFPLAEHGQGPHPQHLWQTRCP